MTIQLGGQTHQGTPKLFTKSLMLVSSTQITLKLFIKSLTLRSVLVTKVLMDIHMLYLGIDKWQVSVLIIWCYAYRWALLVCSAMNLHTFATAYYTQYSDCKQWTVDTCTRTCVHTVTHTQLYTHACTHTFVHTSIVPMTLAWWSLSTQGKNFLHMFIHFCHWSYKYAHV